MRLKGGAIRCDVVGDELSKEGPSSRLASERRVGIPGITAITEAPRASERVEKFLIRGEGRKIPKQARVRARPDALIRTRASRRKTMRMLHIEMIAAVVPWSPHPIGLEQLARNRVACALHVIWTAVRAVSIDEGVTGTNQLCSEAGSVIRAMASESVRRPRD